MKVTGLGRPQMVEEKKEIHSAAILSIEGQMMSQTPEKKTNRVNMCWLVLLQSVNT